MGVRFQRRLKLGKAAHLNFSKSGVGLSLGVPGACVSIGPKGTLLSVGVPGTGLSYRTTTTKVKSPISRDNVHKLIGVDSEKKSLDAAEEKVLPSPQVEEVLAKELSTPDPGYVPAGDEQVRLAIAARLAELGEDVVGFGVNISVTEAGEERFVNTATGEVITDPELIGLIRQMDAYKAMSAQVEAYRRDAWAAMAARLDAKTDELANIYRLTPIVAPRDAARALAGDAEPDAFAEDEAGVTAAVSAWLATLSLPADVSVQFTYDAAARRLWLDVDLPEVEDIPATRAETLKSGRVKEVAKSQRQIRAEYAQCVFGIALFLAGSLFGVTYAPDDMVISAYTQRRNADGDLQNDYIYSVIIPREGMEGLVVEDPEAAFLGFRNRLRLSATKIFSVIKPFAPE